MERRLKTAVPRGSPIGHGGVCIAKKGDWIWDCHVAGGSRPRAEGRGYQSRAIKSTTRRTLSRIAEVRGRSVLWICVVVGCCLYFSRLHCGVEPRSLLIGRYTASDAVVDELID